MWIKTHRYLINEEIGTEWINFTTSLGLGQLISIPTRVTETSSTLIDHIYTNREENILRVHIGKFSLSVHYASFGNRKLNSQLRNKKHHTITYILKPSSNWSLFKLIISDQTLIKLK